MMGIYGYEAAFGAADKTSKAMKEAMALWQKLYYHSDGDRNMDPCQRIGYTVVNKLVKSIFGDYTAYSDDPEVQKLLRRLDALKKEAVQATLVEGECYLKPCVTEAGILFMKVLRSNMLVFARDASGMPTDIGTAERSTYGKYYYTLLERRTVDEQGFLTITNRLFRANNPQNLGTQVALAQHPSYAHLADEYTFEKPLGGIGLVRMKTPMLNCVDGSADGVAVYAAAAGLIENIDINEAQMNGEFRRGQSRIIASADMLRDGGNGIKELTDELFVGLDEDPQNVGMTIFNPQLREQAYLARKQEYLRNVESIVGLKRGMLSDANVEDRTATEIASSAGDFNLTVIEYQQMWQACLQQTVELCAKLAQLYQLPGIEDTTITVDWGNGVLYDEDKQWAAYLQMVEEGLLKPEIALGWRFNLPAKTQEEQEKIRKAWMPAST